LSVNVEGPVLQPGQGRVDGENYLPSSVETVRWGWLANRDSQPVMRLASGSTVTIDAVSHEGLMEDQGRDPVGYLGSLGVPNSMILQDVLEIAANAEHDYDRDGPHVVTGPIAVSGAEPGDLLRIEMLSITRRVPYGFISARHGLGALPGELPRTERHPDASAADPHLYGSVCSFTTVEEGGERELGVLPYGAGLNAKFPLDPFMGVVGVARDTSEPVHSVPPGDHGGNLDIKLLGSGSTLYLPVQVPGGLFYVGDPHFAQGNGEVALTAFEGSLRVTYRLSVVDRSSADACIGLLRHPFAENRQEWIAVGLHVDLNEAMKEATRSAVSFLGSVVGMEPEEAMAYLSAAADFSVSQVVDDVKGVHCTIRKADFPGYEAPELVIR
jgi:acetamidase/formamidase